MSDGGDGMEWRLILEGRCWGVFVSEGERCGVLLPSKGGCWGAWVPESIVPMERGVSRRIRNGVLKIETIETLLNKSILIFDPISFFAT